MKEPPRVGPLQHFPADLNAYLPCAKSPAAASKSNRRASLKEFVAHHQYRIISMEQLLRDTNLLCAFQWNAETNCGRSSALRGALEL